MGYDGTYILSERGGESDICHDSNHHVLLEIKLAGIETPRVTKGGEPPGWEERFEEFAGREGEELSDIGRDRDSGPTNAEELVDKASERNSIR